MKVEIVKADIEVKQTFVEPVFDLPRETAAVFRELRRALHPRYRLGLADMQSFGGQSYDDVRTVLTAFDSRAQVEIRPDSMTSKFFGVTEKDLLVVKDFVKSCEDALKKALAELSFDRVVFKISSWIKCEDREAAIRSLRERGKLALPNGSQAFANFEQTYSIKKKLRNADSDRLLSFVIEESEIVVADLFVSGSIEMPRGSDTLIALMDEAQLFWSHTLDHLELNVGVA